MQHWITITFWIARLVLAILLGLSVWSIGIMIDRIRVFRKITGQTDLDEAKRMIQAGDRKGLENWTTRVKHPGAGVLRAALEAQSSGIESMDRAVRSFLIDERGRLERGLTVLATLGSNAPFIGLFGTVLGIIEAFGELSHNQQGTQAVMSGISEALIATAVGLFVAIPAVIAFNVFSKQVRTYMMESESLRDFFISKSGGFK